MQKLYCYIDETGQDTEGRFFLVVALVASKEAVLSLETSLEEIERESGKRALKWHKTRPTRREAYLRRLLELPELKGSIFYSIFSDTKEYTRHTAETVAQAVQRKATPPYQATILIDGLNEAELRAVRRHLKQAAVK